MKDVKPTSLYSVSDIAQMLDLTAESYKKTKLFKKLLKYKQPGNKYLGVDILNVMSSGSQSLFQLDKADIIDAETRKIIEGIIMKRKTQNEKINSYKNNPYRANKPVQAK